MPKMMPKKITVAEAITLCMQEYDMPDVIENARMNKEMNRCYAEYDKMKAEMAKEVAQRVAEEMEIAWDDKEWNEFMQRMEDDYDTEECIRRYFEELDSEEDSTQEQTGPVKSMKAAKRRKQKARHKKRIRRNAINAVKNNAKRGEEDQMSTSSRGGFVISNPKSRTGKTERIWNQAEKMKLVDDNTVID